MKLRTCLSRPAAAALVSLFATSAGRAQPADLAPSGAAAPSATEPGARSTVHAPRAPSGDFTALADAPTLVAAFFPFSMDDTSLQGSEQGLSDAEKARLKSLDTILTRMLTATGKFVPVDTGKLPAGTLAQVTAAGAQLKVWDCNGCDVDLAQKLGAQVSVAAWVQKVSRLILNVNVTIRSVPGNRLLYGGSVDIRGDTDESWQRGLRYLVKDRMFQGRDDAGSTTAAATSGKATP